MDSENEDDNVRRSYSLKYKLKVANDIVQNNLNISEAARKYEIDQKTAREWRDRLDEFKELPIHKR